jgi:drug/metabolite transporter (DMT)-like permease
MSWVAQLALLGVALIWGWTFVLVKESLSEIGTLAFLFYRFTLAFALLLLLFGPRLRSVEPRVWRRGSLIGVALFLGYWFQTLGLSYTTATNSAFITGLSVVLVPVLGAAVFRERVTGAAWIGATLSALGLGLIVFGSTLARLSLNVGDVFTLLCAISFAMHILLISRYTRPQTYLPILVAQIGVVALLSGVGMVTLEGVVWPTSWAAWKGVVITGILATALAFWVQNRFQPYSTAARTAIIFASEPVFAALLGYWLLGERMVGWQWPGAALILSAMLLSQWPEMRRTARRT